MQLEFRNSRQPFTSLELRPLNIENGTDAVSDGDAVSLRVLPTPKPNGVHYRGAKRKSLIVDANQALPTKSRPGQNTIPFQNLPYQISNGSDGTSRQSSGPSVHLTDA